MRARKKESGRGESEGEVRVKLRQAGVRARQELGGGVRESEGEASVRERRE